MGSCLANLCLLVATQGDNITLADACCTLEHLTAMVQKVVACATSALTPMVVSIEQESALHAGISDALLYSSGLATLWTARLEFMWHDAFCAAVLVHPGLLTKALALATGKSLSCCHGLQQKVCGMVHVAGSHCIFCACILSLSLATHNIPRCCSCSFMQSCASRGRPSSTSSSEEAAKAARHCCSSTASCASALQARQSTCGEKS